MNEGLQKAIALLRALLNDDSGFSWSESNLIEALKKARREYFGTCADCFSWQDIVPDSDGVYRWNKDFVKYHYGVTANNEVYSPATIRRLIEDKPYFAIVDNGDGTYLPFPPAPDGHFTAITIEGNLGEIFLPDEESPADIGTAVTYYGKADSFSELGVSFVGDTEEGYGVVDTIDGKLSGDVFGLSFELMDGEPLGKVHYQAIGDYNDAYPICLLACYYLFQQGGDRCSKNAMEMYLALYNKIVSERKNIRRLAK